MAPVLFKMLTFTVIGCLLTAHIQPSLSDENEHDPDEDEPMSCPTINSPSTEVAIGESVTLKCSSKTCSLPVNYTLYKGNVRVLSPASNKGEEAEFNFTIKLISELGEYKCKAANFNESKYSLGFNFTLGEPVSQPVVCSSSTEISRGENVTLSCFSRTGSLPIKYTLYKGKNRVRRPASKNKTGEAAEFHFPINLINDLGEYKCKAENKFSTGKYSLGFNFTMRGEDNNTILFIVPPLLLLLLALFLAILLLILPRRKARNLRDVPPTVNPASYPGPENDVTYAEIAHEKFQEEYVNLEFSNKKEKRKVSFGDATTVAYSEVIRR
ncbi:allergin-1 [Heteronotia binoei]|uniref:allergin-1 n=1 Tax=Heteronotia binoei TaxID=13085 RepID=UPI00292DAACD|nr:allergin-1 [Heteronotia binoei]